jgi:hypothetical protein
VIVRVVVRVGCGAVLATVRAVLVEVAFCAGAWLVGAEGEAAAVAVGALWPAPTNVCTCELGTSPAWAARPATCPGASCTDTA